MRGFFYWKGIGYLVKLTAAALPDLSVSVLSKRFDGELNDYLLWSGATDTFIGQPARGFYCFARFRGVDAAK